MDKQKKSTSTKESRNPSYEQQTGDLLIKLTNDYFFKALLQKNKSVLGSLIRSLLRLPDNAIKDLEVTNPIILGESAEEKTIILDVNVLLDSGSRVNLEMQVLDERNWKNRSTFYACRNFTELNRGDDYEDLKPVYQISFLNFTLFKEFPALYSTYRLMETEKQYVYNENLMIGIVDLTKTELATEADRHDHIDEWAKLFKAETWEEVKMLAAENANIAEAAKTVYELSQDERIRQQCQAREDYYKRQSGISKRLAKQEKRITEMEDEIDQKNEQLAQRDEQLAQKDKIFDQQREKYIQLLLDKGVASSREEAVQMIDKQG